MVGHSNPIKRSFLIENFKLGYLDAAPNPSSTVAQDARLIELLVRIASRPGVVIIFGRLTLMRKFVQNIENLTGIGFKDVELLECMKHVVYNYTMNLTN